MNRIGALLAGIALAAVSFVASADNMRIGVVDLQKIMQSSPEMQSIQANLEKEFKPRRDKLVAMEEGLKKDMETFKRDSAVMSAEQRKALEKKIVEAQQSFDKDGQQYQQELSTAHNKAMEGFYNKIRAAISTVAKNEKYDLVFQKDAAPYSQDKLDITDKVVKSHGITAIQLSVFIHGVTQLYRKVVV